MIITKKSVGFAATMVTDVWRRLLADGTTLPGNEDRCSSSLTSESRITASTAAAPPTGSENRPRAAEPCS